MTSKQTYFHLSRSRLSSMYKGTFRLGIPFEWPRSLSATPPYLYVYQHHTYVPYKIATWSVRERSITLSIVHFGLLAQDPHTQQSYDIFLSTAWLHAQLIQHFSLESLVFCQGFTVIDGQSNTIGQVAGVQPRTLQPLLLIDTPKGTTEIPLHSQFIKHVDMKLGHVSVSWPPE